MLREKKHALSWKFSMSLKVRGPLQCQGKVLKAGECLFKITHFPPGWTTKDKFLYLYSLPYPLHPGIKSLLVTHASWCWVLYFGLREKEKEGHLQPPSMALIIPCFWNSMNKETLIGGEEGHLIHACVSTWKDSTYTNIVLSPLTPSPEIEELKIYEWGVTKMNLRSQQAPWKLWLLRFGRQLRACFRYCSIIRLQVYSWGLTCDHLACQYWR